MGVEQPFLDAEGGLSWESWQAAGRLLRASGLIGPAEAIENILAGADPREEFCLAGLRAERREKRNAMILALYLDHYACLSPGRAVASIDADWRDYLARAGWRDRHNKAQPPHYSAKWAAFWQICKLGEHVPGARQLRNILGLHLA